MILYTLPYSFQHGNEVIYTEWIIVILFNPDSLFPAGSVIMPVTKHYRLKTHGKEKGSKISKKYRAPCALCRAPINLSIQPITKHL